MHRQNKQFHRQHSRIDLRQLTMSTDDLIETIKRARKQNITLQDFKNSVRDALTEQTKGAGLTPWEFNKRAMATDGAIEVIWKDLDERETRQ